MQFSYSILIYVFSWLARKYIHAHTHRTYDVTESSNNFVYTCVVYTVQCTMYIARVRTVLIASKCYLYMFLKFAFHICKRSTLIEY